MYYVYFIASFSRTIYIGVTNNISRRTKEHKSNYNPKSFSSRYHCYNLVYYECFDSTLDAIDREKQCKRWRRNKKVRLIEEVNPGWQDLSTSVEVTD